MHNMGLGHVKNVSPLINKFLHLVANFANIMDQDNIYVTLASLVE